MIKGELQNSRDAARKLKQFNSFLRDELKLTTTKLTIELHALVVRKLNGPVLHNRTGELSTSINQHVEENGRSFVGIVGTSVAKVPYARIHEFGGIIEAKNFFFKNGSGPWLVFKTADGAWHTVKRVTMPERSYLRSSLADMRSEIIKRYQQAPARAAKRAGL